MRAFLPNGVTCANEPEGLGNISGRFCLEYNTNVVIKVGGFVYRYIGELILLLSCRNFDNR